MASRYASFDSRSSATTTTTSSSSSSTSSSADLKRPAAKSKLSSMKHLMANASGRRGPSDPIFAAAATMKPSSAIVEARPGDRAARNGQGFGAMVKKFMEKKSKPKGGSSVDRVGLVIPPDPVAKDTRKAAGKGSNFSDLHRKLFQKGGSADRSTPKALTEVKTNTRTLAMVLRSERELLSQNKEYESENLELRMTLEEKNREVEKLKDLCFKQREEIKALKDAMLFPDVMDAHLQSLLDRQSSELEEAKQVIPTLQKQVSSLTGQLHCLAEDLAEVKADKYSARSCSDGTFNSPRTPIHDRDPVNSLNFDTTAAIISGSPDDMFLEDLNPCLTPCFSKQKSKEFNEVTSHSS